MLFIYYIMNLLIPERESVDFQLFENTTNQVLYREKVIYIMRCKIH